VPARFEIPRRDALRPTADNRAAQSRHAEKETLMPAYLIGHVNVHNAERWAQYRSSVPATLVNWGGELMFRGRLAETLSGEQPYTETVVLRFPDLASIEGWHRSADYQALIPVRKAAADVMLASYDSGD
jgi:uncharacterized protein (DUF1330 family)